MIVNIIYKLNNSCQSKKTTYTFPDFLAHCLNNNKTITPYMVTNYGNEKINGYNILSNVLIIR